MINPFVKAKLIAKAKNFKINSENINQIILSSPKLNKNELIRFNKYLQLLNKGYPVDFILNQVEFCGNSFIVDRNVLIPRPETEIWVSNLLEKIKLNPNKYKNQILIDVGCGSGIIGLTLAPYFKKVLFLDLYSKPIKNAQKNINSLSKKMNIANVIVAKSNLLEILYEVQEGDLYNKKSNKTKIIYNDNQIYLHFTFPQVKTLNSNFVDVYENLKMNGINTNITAFQKNKKNKQIFINQFLKLNTNYGIDNLCDLLAEIKNNGCFVVANLPYVPNIDSKSQESLITNNIQFEPKRAIFSGETGLNHTIRLLNQIKELNLKTEIHFELDQRQLELFKT